MNISASIDATHLKALTQGQVAKQGTFALAGALTSTAFDARAETQQSLPNWLNLTKTFLPKSVVVKKANKKTLTAEVGFMKRADFASLLEEGGIRKSKKGRNLAIPSEAKRSKRGSITKANRPRQILQKKNTFIATMPSGIKGIWQRTGGRRTRKGKRKIKLLYVFKRTALYEPKKIDFKKTVESVATKRMSVNFEKAFLKALASMK